MYKINRVNSKNLNDSIIELMWILNKINIFSEFQEEISFENGNIKIILSLKYINTVKGQKIFKVCVGDVLESTEIRKNIILKRYNLLEDKSQYISRPFKTIKIQYLRNFLIKCFELFQNPIKN